MRAWRIALLGLLSACGGDALGEGADLQVAVDDLRHGGLQRVTLETGVELAYWEQGSAHGIPVILLHGYTDSHHSFDLNLPRLPRSLHVFALDQRGHGESSKPACCYTQADFAADVPAFMDAVGLERASVVGHSMGSFIAQSVALAFPERVDRLVLIGSAPTIAGNPVALELQAAVDTLSDPIDPGFVRDFQASTFFRPIPASFLDTSVADSLKVPASIWQQALAGLLDEDHSNQLQEIAARTLILFGDQDIFVSAAEQAVLDREIRRSRLITYRQTGHGTHVELPERVSNDIVRFLR
jgi:pimeloyl-ACP methyl ester carboxylesterase